VWKAQCRRETCRVVRGSSRAGECPAPHPVSMYGIVAGQRMYLNSCSCGDHSKPPDPMEDTACRSSVAVEGGSPSGGRHAGVLRRRSPVRSEFVRGARPSRTGCIWGLEWSFPRQLPRRSARSIVNPVSSHRLRRCVHRRHSGQDRFASLLLAARNRIRVVWRVSPCRVHGARGDRRHHRRVLFTLLCRIASCRAWWI